MCENYSTFLSLCYTSRLLNDAYYLLIVNFGKRKLRTLHVFSDFLVTIVVTLKSFLKKGQAIFVIKFGNQAFSLVHIQIMFITTKDKMMGIPQEPI